MNVNRGYVSDNNTYASNNPQYIVVHNTDNFAAGADAKRHASAQCNGNLSTSVHYYTDDSDTAYQAAPHGRGCWHVGVNYGGRLFGTVNNQNTIGVEMCVQAGYNFDRAFANTVALVKQLMGELGIPVDRVLQHYDVCAKNCPSQIRARGMWDTFKKQLGQASAPVTSNLYRVRKSWADAKSQTGAYAVLENAKNACGVGYTVYDWNGKAVYSNGGSVLAPVETTESKFVEMIGKMASADMKKSGILASITTAQAILESGYGSTELAKNANNIFGMKTNLSGNSWGGSTWDGKSIYQKETKEQKADGTEYSIVADFRKYASIADSLGDHSAYLLGAMNGSKLRYEGLKGCLDYKRAAKLIKDGGYATDVSYMEKLCNIIERWNLEKFDGAEPVVEPAAVWYRVRKSWADVKSQKGAFHVLENAKQCADENAGYSVFDDQGKVVYAPAGGKFEPYLVRVKIPDLNIRTGPGTDYDKTGKYTGVGTFTIVEERDGTGSDAGWGRVKSGAGWIALDYGVRV